MFKNVKCRKWWKAAGVRAFKTTCQALGSTLPAGFAITPVMIQNASWNYLYVILAWLGTGLLAGVASLLTSVKGLPECNEEVGFEMLLKESEGEVVGENFFDEVEEGGEVDA